MFYQQSLPFYVLHEFQREWNLIDNETSYKEVWFIYTNAIKLWKKKQIIAIENIRMTGLSKIKCKRQIVDQNIFHILNKFHFLTR